MNVVSNTAYELKLPPSLKIHPVFHISQLKPYIDGSADFPLRSTVTRPPPDVAADGTEEWEVDRIVDERIRKYGRSERKEYLVLWKDYPDYEQTWEPISHLKHAQEKIHEFIQSKKQ